MCLRKLETPPRVLPLAPLNVTKTSAESWLGLLLADFTTPSLEESTVVIKPAPGLTAGGPQITLPLCLSVLNAATGTVIGFDED